MSKIHFLLSYLLKLLTVRVGPEMLITNEVKLKAVQVMFKAIGTE